MASKETEPGNGWLYSGWLGELAQNPAMDGAALGVAICNSYYEGCGAVGTAEQTTLSVTDLTKLTPLLDAYEAFGQEAFAAAAEDPGFFAQLGRAAAQSENYGGNTREQGYTNMVDLGHLARQTAWMLPSAQGVCDALDGCPMAILFIFPADHLCCHLLYAAVFGNPADYYGNAADPGDDRNSRQADVRECGADQLSLHGHRQRAAVVSGDKAGPAHRRRRWPSFKITRRCFSSQISRRNSGGSTQRR